jgi:hypothetical protein
MAEMTPRSTGTDRLALIRDRLFTSVIGDVMDMMGLRQQFLPPHIRALAPEMMLDAPCPCARRIARRKAISA